MKVSLLLFIRKFVMEVEHVICNNLVDFETDQIEIISLKLSTRNNSYLYILSPSYKFYHTLIGHKF